MDHHIILGLVFVMMPFCGASSLSYIWSPSSLRAERHLMDVESLKCIVDFFKQVKALRIKEGNIAQVATLNQFFSESRLTVLCYEYRNASHCISNSNQTDMGPGSATAHFLMGTKGIRFLCVDRYDELLSHLPCYSKSADEVHRECDPACELGVLADKVLEEQQRPRLVPRDVVKMLENLCNALSCELDCQENVMVTICPKDPGATAFKRIFVAKSFSAIKQLLSSLPDTPNSDLDYVLKRWPTQCDILGGFLGAIDHLFTLDDNGANSTASIRAHIGSDTNSSDNSPARFA